MSEDKREACARALCRIDYYNERYIDCADTKKNRERLKADVDAAWKEYLPEVDAILAELREPSEAMEWPDYKGAEAFYRHYWSRMAKAEWEDLSPSTRLNYAEAFGVGRQAMIDAVGK